MIRKIGVEQAGGGAERPKKERLLTCAGAVVACLIGSGYATGQEILQFFAAYGRWGFLGLGLSLGGLVLVTEQVMRDAFREQIERADEAAVYYCGRRIGGIFRILMPVILFATLVVMISGAGTAMEEYYGWHPYLGRVLILLPVCLTAVMGLDLLVAIIGRLGPFTIVFTLVICVYSIRHGGSGLGAGLAFVESAELPRAGGNWWLAALLYTSFNLTMSLAFFAGLGAHAASRREAVGGSILGAAAYGVAAFFMNGALILHLPSMEGIQIPMLYLADRIHPLFGYLFSLILISEIYTTAVPALWALIRMFHAEGEPGYRRAAVLFTAAGFLCSLCPFEALVGHLYPLIGYAGILLIAGIVRKRNTK